MMPLAGARRRAEEFARAVDGPTRTVADEHRVFLELVAQLRSVDGPSMRPEFATDLRSRLLHAAPEALAEPTRAHGRDAALVRFPGSPRRRTATVAATACLIVATGVGVAAASQSALPGDALYPLKRGIEQAELHFAGSQAARGGEYLDQASTRLSEVTELSLAHADDPTTPALVTKALTDFIQESNAGGDALLSAYTDDRSAESIARLREFTAESARQLEALTNDVPSDADQALADAANTLTHLDQQAQAACPQCSSLPSLQLSAALSDLQHASSGSTDGYGSSGGLVASPGVKGGSTGRNPSATTGTAEGPVTIPDVSADLDPSAGATPSDPQSTTTPTQGGPLPSLPSVPTGQTSAPSLPVPTISISIPLPTLPNITVLSVPLPPALGEPTDPLGGAGVP
ncbi:MAG: DUF5667 domain-containing protein [Nocardioidaceae bacterium]